MYLQQQYLQHHVPGSTVWYCLNLRKRDSWQHCKLLKRKKNC